MNIFTQSFQESSWGFVALFVIGCQVISFLFGHWAGAFKPQPWVNDTAKPKLWPRWWIFPLIWILNYTLMGLAVWHVGHRRQETLAGWALAFFAVHLVHNLTFLLIVYKVKKRSFYALMDAVGLLLVVVTTAFFFGVYPPAGLLMLPYLAWMCFTTLIKVLWWRMETKPLASTR